MRRLVPWLLCSVVSLSSAAAAQGGGACETAGLKLPAGFCATIYADSLPGVRQIAIAPNGDMFVGMQGRSGGVMALRDKSKFGHPDVRERFASGFGSSQLALFNGYLYTEATPAAPPRGQVAAGGSVPTIAILRYKVAPGALTPSGSPDTVVQSLPYVPGHATRNFAITRDGILYVNIGSRTNTCQEKDRVPRVPGANPCTELETRAGIWKFDARREHQTPSATNHFARGIRNAVGITVAPDGKLWATQHGRDDLASWFAALGMDSVTAIHYNAENPAEELLQVNQNDDFGWPYCYYSFPQKHLVLAPEYGGDGRKTAQCTQKKEPVAVFPGHWAPNALLMYTGRQFPARYRSGAFIAFHGSWNRAPEPQAGYNVVFQPLDRNGRAAGKYEVFADAFAPNVGAGRANAATGAHRPTGLAEGPDGALYVADDTGGRIYRITYSGK